MNKIRPVLFMAGAILALLPGNLHAQTSIQRITFSLYAEFQTNTFYTNLDNAAGPLTNEYSGMRHILIGTHSVLKSIAVDMEGTNWTNWDSASIVREVNLTNGNEGIFLRTTNGLQTNVSSYFVGSYSNNFTSGLTNAFPGVTNNFPAPPTLNLNRGWVRMPTPTNFTTNYTTNAGLYFVSVNTTNMKFNLVASGDGLVTDVSGYVDGVLYSQQIDSESVGTAGGYYLNVTTNVFNMGTNPPVFYSGPMRGTFTVGRPVFSKIPGP